jgi:pimeloyl-ACP methyl ester carboxylesterase
MPTASVRGVKLNYDVVGTSGPWVVLIQGGRQDMELFRPLAENVAQAGFRVLIHDRRNSGGSEIALSDQASEEETFADDAQALAQQLNALPAIACGGAGGSRHCILLTLRHPEAIKSLLLWWPSGGRPAAEELAELYYGQYLKAAQQGGMQAVLETPYYAERVQRVPANRERLLNLDPEEFIRTMQRWKDFFLHGADMPVIGVPDTVVSTITLPTCIIPGHDMIHPQAIGEQLSRTLPNAELHYLPPLERPAPPQARLEHQRRLADTFLDFLQRHPEAIP